MPVGFASMPRHEFEGKCCSLESEKRRKVASAAQKCEARLAQNRLQMHGEHAALEREFLFLHRCLGNLAGIIESVENVQFSVDGEHAAPLSDAQAPATLDELAHSEAAATR